jgi:hypothetical protein
MTPVMCGSRKRTQSDKYQLQILISQSSFNKYEKTRGLSLSVKAIPKIPILGGKKH